MPFRVRMPSAGPSVVWTSLWSPGCVSGSVWSPCGPPEGGFPESRDPGGDVLYLYNPRLAVSTHRIHMLEGVCVRGL